MVFFSRICYHIPVHLFFPKLVIMFLSLAKALVLWLQVVRLIWSLFHMFSGRNAGVTLSNSARGTVEGGKKKEVGRDISIFL